MMCIDKYIATYKGTQSNNNIGKFEEKNLANGLIMVNLMIIIIQ